MRAMNHPDYVYRPTPAATRAKMRERAKERADWRLEQRRVSMIEWMTKQRNEDMAELKGMTGTGCDVYAITRRIELEARVKAWNEGLAHAHSVAKARILFPVPPLSTLSAS